MAKRVESRVHKGEEIRCNDEVVFEYDDAVVGAEHMGDTIDDRTSKPFVEEGREGMDCLESLEIVEEPANAEYLFGLARVGGSVHEEIQLAVGTFGTTKQRIDHSLCGFVALVNKNGNGGQGN